MKLKNLVIPILLTACESFNQPPVIPRKHLKPNLTLGHPITNIDGVIKKSQIVSAPSPEFLEISQTSQIQILATLNRQHQAQLLEQVNRLRSDTRQFVNTLELDSNNTFKDYARFCALLTMHACSAEKFNEEDFNFQPESSYIVQSCVNRKLKNCINVILDLEEEAPTIQAKYK